MDGKETNYTVTNTGIVYSLNYNKTGKKRALSQIQDKDGYLHVTLHVNGRQIFPLVSRLVAIAFIPIPKHYLDDGYTSEILQVNHLKGGIEGIKDNSITNLEWCTGKENIIHAYKNGLAHGLCGEASPVHKHDAKIVVSICKDIESNRYTLKEISKRYNVKKTFIESIYYKRTWLYISDNYDFSKFNKFKKISEKDVHKICSYIQENQLDLSDISFACNIPYHIVKSIFYGQTWKRISSKYDFSKYDKCRTKKERTK